MRQVFIPAPGPQARFMYRSSCSGVSNRQSIVDHAQDELVVIPHIVAIDSVHGKEAVVKFPGARLIEALLLKVIGVKAAR